MVSPIIGYNGIYVVLNKIILLKIVYKISYLNFSNGFDN